jgi:hypothetical protein
MKVLFTDRPWNVPEGEVQSDDFGEELSAQALSVSRTKKTWTFHVTIVEQVRLHARHEPGDSPGAVRGGLERPPGDCEAGRDPRMARCEAGTFRAGCEAYARRKVTRGGRPSLTISDDQQLASRVAPLPTGRPVQSAEWIATLPICVAMCRGRIASWHVHCGRICHSPQPAADNFRGLQSLSVNHAVTDASCHIMMCGDASIDHDTLLTAGVNATPY